MRYEITCPELNGIVHAKHRRTAYDSKTLRTLKAILTLIDLAKTLEELRQALTPNHIDVEGRLILDNGSTLQLHIKILTPEHTAKPEPCLVIERLICQPMSYPRGSNYE